MDEKITNTEEKIYNKAKTGQKMSNFLGSA